MEEENKNSEKANEWKKREIGALWKKSGKSQNYFSGKVNLESYKDLGAVNIVGFANKGKKENANAPDVILYYSPPAGANPLDLNSEAKSSVEVKSPTEAKSPTEDEVPF